MAAATASRGKAHLTRNSVADGCNPFQDDAYLVANQLPVARVEEVTRHGDVIQAALIGATIYVNTRPVPPGRCCCKITFVVPLKSSGPGSEVRARIVAGPRPAFLQDKDCELPR